MRLLPRYPSLKVAWKAYLDYSPVAAQFFEHDIKLQERSYSVDRSVYLPHPSVWKEMWDKEKAFEFSILNFTEDFRRFQLRELIHIGFLEFATDASIFKTAECLSHLADFTLKETILALTQEDKLQDRWIPDPFTFTIIALGKCGGSELNFYSDIDLLFMFDGTVIKDEADHYLNYYEKFSQRVINVLSKKTALGSLYRVDMRLRPGGEIAPLIRSEAETINYYHSQGEMWERLAMLKARYAAGSAELAYDFSRAIQSFCYTKDLNSALIVEIDQLKKRNENENVGIDLLDIDVKLGRGGIRDLEFFIQGHQLLYGHRSLFLQRASTIPALEGLRDLEWITAEECTKLRNAYTFWRKVEHRLQMKNHLQTHLLPTDKEEMGILAQSLGFENADIFWEKQLEFRSLVRSFYERFFEPIREDAENFSFDPDTSFYKNPKQAQRNWEHLQKGQEDIHQSQRTLTRFHHFARALEKNLTVCLQPDQALNQITRFIDAYGARSYLFESLTSNPKALELLLKILDQSSFVGDQLCADPDLFESVARGNLDYTWTWQDYLEEWQSVEFSALSEKLRQSKSFHLLRIYVRFLLKLAPLSVLQKEWTTFADSCLQQAYITIAPLQPFAVIGLGKCGGEELGFCSDLDLLFIGDNEKDVQALIQIFTEKTEHGALFPIDVRLRPHGKGSLSYQIPFYEEYYSSQAQTWEKQALTKARVVTGDTLIGESFMKLVKHQLLDLYSFSRLKADMRLMRTRIQNERSETGKDELEFKTGVGGMTDIEFIVQYLQIINEKFEPNTDEALSQLGEIEPQLVDLQLTYTFFREIETLLRIEKNQAISHIPEDMIPFFQSYYHMHDFMDYLRQKRVQVRSVFDKIFG
jgi:glutamate-ammonia-ligase adenylyltransferase